MTSAVEVEKASKYASAPPESLSHSRSAWSSNSPDCPFYTRMAETTLHATGDCFMASRVWIPLVRHDQMDNFYLVNLTEWIEFNLSYSFGSEASQKRWDSIFFVACFM